MKKNYSNLFKPSKKTISKTISLLKAKKLVAIPTETVYGLAGNAYSDIAVSKIYSLKKRPKKNPIIIHYESLKDSFRNLQIVDWGEVPYFDLVINATSAGSYNDLNSTPFDIGILKTAKADCVIYDIIYDPLKTKLLLASENRGLKTINGLRMNLVQAVLAYKYTNSTNLSIEQIFEEMNS